MATARKTTKRNPRSRDRSPPIKAAGWAAAGIGVGLAALWYSKEIAKGGRALLASIGASVTAPRDDHAAAFRQGSTDPENLDQTRDAGPAAMRDPARRDWNGVDQASDESFPASDPPPVSPGIG